MALYNFTKPVEITAKTAQNVAGDCLVLPLDIANFTQLLEKNTLNSGEILSSEDCQFIAKVAKINNFEAKCGSSLVISGLPKCKIPTILLYGLGEMKECKLGESAGVCTKFAKFEEKGGKIGAELLSLKAKDVAILASNISNQTNCCIDKISLAIASGIVQRSYNFSKHITKKETLEKLPSIKNIAIITDADISCKVKEQNLLLESVYITRDLCNEPANIIYPEIYANIIKEEMEGMENISIDILDLKTLEKLGMGSLLGVSLGSDKEPRVVVVTYKGNKDKVEFDLALVGKGVTFDSGGLSIKPENSMEDMKDDMAGSATVFSSVRLLAKRKAKVNVLCALGIVENMINGVAQKPGDIVKSMSGQTIEVLNTDAEGRLILADVLYYIKTKYNPERIIDFATLTGAIVVSLGYEYAGLFSNHDCFAKSIENAGIQSGEKCWKLPMSKEYDRLIDSPIADMKNISRGSGAGSITAAQFLQRFIDGHEKWAHIDIAGVGGLVKTEKPLSKGGASGFGIKLVDRYIRNNLEECSNKCKDSSVTCQE